MTNEQKRIFLSKIKIIHKIIVGKNEKIYLCRGVLRHEFQFARSFNCNKMYIYHRIGYFDRSCPDKNCGKQILLEMMNVDEFGNFYNYPIFNVPEIFHEMKIMPYKNNVDFEKLFSKMNELIVKLI